MLGFDKTKKLTEITADTENGIACIIFYSLYYIFLDYEIFLLLECRLTKKKYASL